MCEILSAMLNNCYLFIYFLCAGYLVKSFISYRFLSTTFESTKLIVTYCINNCSYCTVKEKLETIIQLVGNRRVGNCK